MNRLRHIYAGAFLSTFCFACQSDVLTERRNLIETAAAAPTPRVSPTPLTRNTNTNGIFGNTRSANTSASNTRNTERLSSTFNLSASSIEKAFNEGESAGQDDRRSRSPVPPPTFGTEKLVDLQLSQGRLRLSIVFKSPYDEATELGYRSGRSGAASDRSAMLSAAKYTLAQNSRQVSFLVAVKEWDGMSFDDDNTPRVRFHMEDAANDTIESTNNPRLDFCTGYDVVSCFASTPVTFPLYREGRRLLTDKMESVSITVSAGQSSREVSFRLK